MKITVTGRGTSGSWIIRGEQLGAALGASVEPLALRTTSDYVIGVKRIPDALAQAARGRLLWDVVDAFPQPHGNRWGEGEAKAWLRSEVRRLQPVGIIAATSRMAADCAEFGIPVLWLPHHHRPWIKRNPIRQRIETVGYEGGARYIDGWRDVIERECDRIGARFVVNPESLSDLDVVLALRTDKGYAPRHWKSNVKLANAHGSGTPFIGCRESGYLEMATGSELWADTPAELSAALDELLEWKARKEISSRFLSAALSVDAVAARLKAWITAL